jgi:hypothetical protein
MTTVTFHYARPGRDFDGWELTVSEPDGATATREPDDDFGAVWTIDLPEGNTQVTYTLNRKGTTDPGGGRPQVLDLEAADEDLEVWYAREFAKNHRAQFLARPSDGGPPDGGGPADDDLAEIRERLDHLGSWQDELREKQERAHRRWDQVDQRVVELDASLVAVKHDVESGLTDLLPRVTELEVAAEQARHLPRRLDDLDKRVGSPVVQPQTQQTGDVADLADVAEAAARRVHDRLHAMRRAFVADLGLDDRAVGDGTDRSPAAQTARQLLLAEGSARDRADRYAALQADADLRAGLTRETFAAEVHRAGAYLRALADRAEQQAREAQPDQAGAYRALQQALHAPQHVQAVDTLATLQI